MTSRKTATALEWTPEEMSDLQAGTLPRGPELVRIRTELVALCQEHAPSALPRAQWLLLWAELDSHD